MGGVKNVPNSRVQRFMKIRVMPNKVPEFMGVDNVVHGKRGWSEGETLHGKNNSR